MNNGWIKLHRKAKESTVWKNPITWMVWTWCLMKASHKESKFPFNGDDIVLKPGEFITGRKKATSEMPISERQYRTAIDYLTKTQKLTSKTTNRFTLISVNKWHKYQNSDQLIDQQTTNKRPHTITNKNVKNNTFYKFKDGTKGFKDKYTGKWKEIDTFKELLEPYLSEVKQ